MAYGFSREFSMGLLALTCQDRGFGYRIAEVIDPSQIKYKVPRTVFSSIQSYAKSNGNIPERRTLREIIHAGNYRGQISDRHARGCLKAVNRSFRARPIPRLDAVNILNSSLLDVEIKQALDEGWGLWKRQEYDEFFRRVEDARKITSRLDLGGKGVNMRKGLDKYLEKIAQGAAKVKRYPLGVTALDKLIKGGLGRGELGCVLGPEKGGKSMALAHIAATSVMLGLNVVYLSFELSELEIENRISANMTNIMIDAIEDGGVRFAAKLGEKLRSIFDHADGNLIVKAFGSKTAGVRDCEAYIRDVVIREEGIHPDVLIFDYADEMKAEGASANGENTYLQMGDIYSGIRALGAPPDSSTAEGGGFNCVVWTASQVQRAALGKELLEFRDVADSIRKAAIVDLMVATCQTEEEQEVGQHRLFVALCRYAPGYKEVGPFAQDFEHGRLVKFDNTVRRFRSGLWQKTVSQPRIAPKTRGIVVASPLAVGEVLTPSMCLRSRSRIPSANPSRCVPRFASHRRAAFFAVPVVA